MRHPLCCFVGVLLEVVKLLWVLLLRGGEEEGRCEIRKITRRSGE